MISLKKTMLLWEGKAPNIEGRSYEREKAWQWRARVKDGVACTTDGHRAHYERVPELSDGSYELTTHELRKSDPETEFEAPFFEWASHWHMEKDQILLVRAGAKPAHLWASNPLDRKGFTCAVPLSSEAPMAFLLERTRGEKKLHKTERPHLLTLGKGKPEGVYVAHQYLRDGLNHALPKRDSRALLHYKHSDSPVIIGNPEESETFAIIMPMLVPK